MKEISRKDITLGLIIVLAIGVPAIVLAILLSRPGRQAEPTPSPTLTLTAPATATVQEIPTETPVAATATITATLPPSATPGPVTHVVTEGDTLSGLAVQYDVTIEDLMQVNDLEDEDFIRIGQTLTIPVGTGETAPAEELTATPTVTPTATTEASSGATAAMMRAGYPARLEENLNDAYPAEEVTRRFTVHYTPGTYPEHDLEAVVDMLTEGLEHIESTLDAEITGSFDVYVAGSIFAPPDQALRGRSFSAARRCYFLHDGTGTPADQQNIATHEMTHLFSWNVFGRPVSAMLSEGVAVYTGMTLIEDAGHVSIQDVCGALLSGDELPHVTSSLRFDGRVDDLPHYYTAGCFVQYLIETYGPGKFGDLYPTGDYRAVYDKSLAELEAEWLAELEASGAGRSLDADAWLDAAHAIGRAYDELFAGFDASDEAWAVYQEIDAARVALVDGRLEDLNGHLAAAAALE